jgi:ankyrin repeat protein
MPTRPLPNDPSFEHLKKDAKRLRRAVLAGEPDALALVHEHHPRGREAPARFALSDAQLATARSYGFTSWALLKAHLAAIAPFVWNPPPPPLDASSVVDVFIHLACLDYGSWRPSHTARIANLLARHPEVVRANIWCAAAAGDVTAVGSMLDRDPRLVHTKGGPLGWVPLLYACYSRVPPGDVRHSTLDVARLLLRRGADPDAGFLWGGAYAFTALTGAFGRGEDWDNQPPHPECEALATALLDAGADPNDSQTLYNRHFRENDDHLRLLFKYGLGRETRGPWLARLNHRQESPARMLVQELCWAAIHHFPKRVALLVEHGVDINAPSPRSGRNAYEEALRAGDEDIADYLRQRGGRALMVFDALETFAHACLAGRGDEVRARLADDPQLLEKLGARGRVELMHRVVDTRNHEAVRLAVEIGLDVNAMLAGTGYDRAVLHNAAGWGGLAMVELLLSLGADPHLRDLTYHATAIGWADHSHQTDVVEHLLPFADIFDAVRCSGVDRVRELLEARPALAAAKDASGYPLAFYLPVSPQLDAILDLLLAHGMEINESGPKGETMLDRVEALAADDLARRLRARGARTAAELSRE